MRHNSEHVVLAAVVLMAVGLMAIATAVAVEVLIDVKKCRCYGDGSRRIECCRHNSVGSGRSVDDT